MNDSRKSARKSSAKPARSAADLIQQVSADQLADALRDVKALKAQLRESEKRTADLRQHLRDDYGAKAKAFVPAPPIRKAKASKHEIRVIVPDSHGAHIDPVAARVFLRDMHELHPDRYVWLGDHVDCGGVFSAHQRSYSKELTESYEDDCAAANALLDGTYAASPNAENEYIPGNHEDHVERWIAREFTNYKDAEALLAVYGPKAKLFLDRRGFRYYRSSECHHGLTVPGAIKIGKCHFVHGISHSKNADAAHLAAFNANVVFGHVHRSMSVVGRTVSSQGHGAWCVGTLAKLQPLYMHTKPTTWTHGYGLQFANKNSGRFTHFNVPIYADGTSGLSDLVGGLKR